MNNYQYHVFNLDALTYAGNLENLRDVGRPNYTFVKVILQMEFLEELFTLTDFSL